MSAIITTRRELREMGKLRVIHLTLTTTETLEQSFKSIRSEDTKQNAQFNKHNVDASQSTVILFYGECK